MIEPTIMLYNWITRTDLLAKADLVFAMAGRMDRKRYALELIDDGLASKLLLSVARCEIRSFNELQLAHHIDLPRLAARIPPRNRHFFVYVEKCRAETELIRKARLGTLAEIRALSDWLSNRRNIRSILIISSATHLRRIRMCCRVLLSAHIQCYFVSSEMRHPGRRPVSWWRCKTTRSMVLSEIPKLLLYWFVLLFEPSSSKVRYSARSPISG
jgi:hypothetical protein